MPGIVVGHIEVQKSLEKVFAEFEIHNPGFQLGCGIFQDKEGTLASSHGGVRHVWIEQGEGNIYLEAGYRTKEGDGEQLPETYSTDQLDKEVLEILRFVSANLSSIHEKVQAPVNAIISRLTGNQLAGDIAGEVWRILESGIEPELWAKREDVKHAISLLCKCYMDIGWSTKEVSSFEPIQSGDQIIIAGNESVRVQGSFRYWWIEDLESKSTHISTARRLRYIKDTAGGCNFAFDAFRRLPLTWYSGTEFLENPDGINRVNSHVVNIAAETSQTHYHPQVAVGGGKPQHEMYLVLDPLAYSLNTYGRKSVLHIYPDLNDFSQFEETPLCPGAIVYIRPGTGHRGINVFVNVVTLPGFKPKNEIYLDRAIKDSTGGKVPYNENVVV